MQWRVLPSPWAPHPDQWSCRRAAEPDLDLINTQDGGACLVCMPTSHKQANLGLEKK